MPTPTPTPTSTPTPEPSPTPTDGIQVHSNEEIGLFFDEVPELSGDEAEVYNWIAIYQTAFWETVRTNQVCSSFAVMSSTEIQDTMARIASNNAADDVTIAGEFHTRISDIVVTGDTATGLKCDDFSRATFTTPDGTFTAQEAQQDIPQRNRLELYRLANGDWYVNRLVGEGTC